MVLQTQEVPKQTSLSNGGKAACEECLWEDDDCTEQEGILG